MGLAFSSSTTSPWALLLHFLCNHILQQVSEFFDKILDYDKMVFGMGVSHSFVTNKRIASKVIAKSTILMASLLLLLPISMMVRISRELMYILCLTSQLLN